MHNLLKLKLALGFTCSLFAFIGCNSAPIEENNQKLYFDIEKYFSDEIKILNQGNSSIHKTIEVNGEKEQKTLNNVNFQLELQEFLKADINKNAWRGSFDTFVNDSSLIYKRNQVKIPYKEIVLHRAGDVFKVQIIAEKSNILYLNIDTLVYEKNVGYQINRYQKIRFLSPKKYVIRGEFLNK